MKVGSSLSVNIKFEGCHFASFYHEFWTYSKMLKVQFYALTCILRMLGEWAEMLVEYFRNIAFSNFHDGHIMY